MIFFGGGGSQTFAWLQTGGGGSHSGETQVWPRVSDQHNPPVSAERQESGKKIRSSLPLAVAANVPAESSILHKKSLCLFECVEGKCNPHLGQLASDIKIS